MIQKFALGAALASGLAGVALAQAQSTPPASPTASPTGAAQSTPARACFFSRDVRGFAAPDSKTLYLRVRSKDVYRLDMRGRCADLDWEHHVGLDSRGSSSICAPIDVTVMVRGPIGVSRCPVEAITRLTPEEVAALPKRARP